MEGNEMGSILGGQQVKPSVGPSLVGQETQTNFFDALFGSALFQKPEGGSAFYGMPGYPGPLSPDPKSTILPNVRSSWQPLDAGTMYLGDQVINNKTGVGVASPILSGLQKYGNTGGPGGQGMVNTMQYGSPSKPIGDAVHNLMLYGTAGPAGVPLNAMAQGYNTGPASWLQPFLLPSGSRPSFYQSPMIPLAA